MSKSNNRYKNRDTKSIAHVHVYIPYPKVIAVGDNLPASLMTFRDKKMTNPYTCREVEGCNAQYRVNEEQRLVCENGHQLQIKQYEIIEFNVVFV